MEILNSCSDCDEIQFKEDGNWAPMRSKKEVQEVPASFNGVDSGMRVSSFHELGSFVGSFSLDVLFPHRHIQDGKARAKAIVQ